MCFNLVLLAFQQEARKNVFSFVLFSCSLKKNRIGYRILLQSHGLASEVFSTRKMATKLSLVAKKFHFLSATVLRPGTSSGTPFFTVGGGLGTRLLRNHCEF